ncbi:MAG: response regulator [Candidatus Sericytochromatia bacterium]
MDIENKSIMLVDDEPISALLLKKYLVEEGYDVTYLNSATKGVEAFKNKFYPLVISDVNMPDMGGLAFLRWINENSPLTDVILITGYATPEIKEAGAKRGAVNFFEKPLDFSKFTKFVNSKFKKEHFTANLKDISLTEFIEMILSLNKKRRIIINDQETNKESIIYIHEGSIVEAEFEDLRGEEAFNKIISLNNGIFRDDEWIQPKFFSINKNSKELFEEAGRIKNKKNNNSFDANSEEIIKLKSTKNLLVVEPELLTRLVIEKYLNQHGYNCIAIDSSIQALQLLTKEKFDLVITSTNVPELSGIDLLLWIKNNFPKTKVIIMTSFASDSVKNFVNQNGALAYLEKPIDLKELDSFIINQLLTGRFSGYLRYISLLDYIRILVADNSTKKIYINDVVVKKSGTIYIKEGNIIYSEYDGIEGEEAFFSILRMEYGVFTDVEWNEPDKVNIATKFEMLLVEAQIIGEEENIKKRVRTREEKNLVKSGIFSLSSNRVEYVSIGNIDEEKLGVFGLYIGKSTKQDVIETMKRFSSIDAKEQMYNQLISYDDISLRILFNDKGVIEEFTFGEQFKGKTYSGLSIGDTIQRAIEIYGKPITVTIKGAVWKHIACFSIIDQKISSIRLRGSNFFENTTTQEFKLSDSEKKVLEMARNRALIPETLGLDFTIYNNGAMGIFLGKTNRIQVKEIMDKYSKGFNDLRSNTVKYIYDDISVIIIFDENGIVKEMSFGLMYKGKTQKGLSIGNTLVDARAMYGKPKFESFNNLIWNNFSVFSDDSNIIDSIRIHLV